MSFNHQTLTLIFKQDMARRCGNCKKEYKECKKCNVYIYFNMLLNILISRKKKS